MPSREFTRLKRNIERLKNAFLDFDKRTDGRYSENELMRCRAFIAFAHAEVEHYLEIMALKALDRAEKKWDTRKAASKVLAGLLAFRQKEPPSLPDNPREQASEKKLPSLIKVAFANQRRVVSGNNGLRARNVSDLYIPLGIRGTDIEEPLLIQLENFGKLRGDLVHTNAQVSLPRIRDPFDDEYSDVSYLLNELQQFDKIASSL